MNLGVSEAALWPYRLPRSGNDAISHAVGAIDQSLFREYDVRGLTADKGPDESTPLNDFAAKRIGKAFGTLLLRQGVSESVVGFDSRSYSEPLANAVMLGILSTGVSVCHLGLTTTPMVYFAQHEFKIAAGVSITASHNPNGWAGLKLAQAPSVTLGPTEMNELRDIVNSGDFARGNGGYREESVTDRYIEYVANLSPADRPLRVVLDGANSISGPIAELALKAAGHDVIAINRDLDWTFPNHEPDPETMSARVQIQEEVTKHNADIGISLDGDGDRLGVTDELGKVVWSDSVLAVLAEDVLARHPASTIVYDVKCSRALAEVIGRAGGKPLMWMTGHSHIKNKMREVGAPFAGERSGHFFDAADYLGFDDAVHAALKLLMILSKGHQTISERIASYPQFESTPAMQAECADSTKYDVVERFASYASELGANEIIRTNGVRAEFDSGWILVRASSNLPALVIIAEAETAGELKSLYDTIRGGLDREAEVSREWSNDPWAVHS